MELMLSQWFLHSVGGGKDINYFVCQFQCISLALPAVPGAAAIERGMAQQPDEKTVQIIVRFVWRNGMPCLEIHVVLTFFRLLSVLGDLIRKMQQPAAVFFLGVGNSGFFSFPIQFYNLSVLYGDSPPAKYFERPLIIISTK